MARLEKRKRILFVLVGGVICLAVAAGIWWLKLPLSITSWPASKIGYVIVMVALAFFTFIGTRKSKVNTKGGDNHKPHQT